MANKQPGRVLDLTGKLGLAGKPRIKVGDVELVVNDSARDMLRIMQISGGDVGPSELMEMCGLLFDADGRDALDALDLSLDDYTVVIDAAISLVTGEGDDDGGNAGTPATT